MHVHNERAWAMATHLSALAGVVFPPLWLLGPLMVWRLGRDASLVDRAGRRAINFQLTVLLALVVVSFALSMARLLGLHLAFGPFVVAVVTVVLGLLAWEIAGLVRVCLALENGREADYPASLRFLKVRSARDMPHLLA